MGCLLLFIYGPKLIIIFIPSHTIMTDSLMTTYSRLPVTFEHGKGTQLWDTNGKQYLDALGGIAVCGLGHAHPAVSQAICEQANKLIHTSNLYGIQRQVELGDKLCALSGMSKVFFSNSGAEANEAAIKLARMYGHHKRIQTPEIIAMENSFHGRTMATLSATGNRRIQAGFEPLVQGFVRAPFNDLDALQTIASNSPNVVAILVEPIQGEGGILMPDDDYLTGIRKICDENNWLMMLDEIQTGMCRTGKWFAFQHNNITPDVMTLAKSLGNGMPIGACLANGKAADVLQPGTHGSTYGGNPLACNAAIAVISTLETENLEQRAASLGTKIITGLQSSLENTAGVSEIRGKGLMIGIELERPCGELVNMGLEAGILINVTANNVVRLLPPLIISNDEADQIVKMTSKLIVDFLDQQSD